jgi:hypothetical protein
LKRGLFDNVTKAFSMSLRNGRPRECVNFDFRHLDGENRNADIALRQPLGMGELDPDEFAFIMCKSGFRSGSRAIFFNARRERSLVGMQKL